jgi:hypothetical protein
MVAWRGKMAKDGARALFWICLGRRQRFISVGYFRKRTLCLSSAHSVKGSELPLLFFAKWQSRCLRGELHSRSAGTEKLDLEIPSLGR